MKLLEIVHPAAKSLVDVSLAQDAEVGDGTTSVVILAGEFLKEAKPYVEEGVHPRVSRETGRSGGSSIDPSLHSRSSALDIHCYCEKKLAPTTADYSMGWLFPCCPPEHYQGLQNGVAACCSKGQGAVRQP